MTVFVGVMYSYVLVDLEHFNCMFGEVLIFNGSVWICGVLLVFVEMDPKVGTIIFNMVFKWDGVVFVFGFIMDMGNVGIGSVVFLEKLIVFGSNYLGIWIENIDLGSVDSVVLFYFY